MKVRVTSPIKYGKKIHPVGAVIDIADRDYRPGLHVEPVASERQPPAAGKPDEKGGKAEGNK
jgi:hypothetical protein